MTNTAICLANFKDIWDPRHLQTIQFSMVSTGITFLTSLEVWRNDWSIFLSFQRIYKTISLSFGNKMKVYRKVVKLELKPRGHKKAFWLLLRISWNPYLQNIIARVPIRCHGDQDLRASRDCRAVGYVRPKTATTMSVSVLPNGPCRTAHSWVHKFHQPLMQSSTLLHMHTYTRSIYRSLIDWNVLMLCERLRR